MPAIPPFRFTLDKCYKGPPDLNRIQKVKFEATFNVSVQCLDQVLSIDLGAKRRPFRKLI